MKRDKAAIEANKRPLGHRVQHRVTARHGQVIETPESAKVSSHYFVEWDGGDVTAESPRHLADEYFA